MNARHRLRADEPAAYLYRGGFYCPACVIEMMIDHGEAAPAASDMPTETVLDQCAEAIAIDRTHESSFVSDEFPKPVEVESIVEGELCDCCHHPL